MYTNPAAINAFVKKPVINTVLSNFSSAPARNPPNTESKEANKATDMNFAYSTGIVRGKKTPKLIPIISPTNGKATIYHHPLLAWHIQSEMRLYMQEHLLHLVFSD